LPPQPSPPTPPSGPGGGGVSPVVLLPGDPNEKTGPAGFGEQHIITASSELRYTVYFENVITATAPAQEVFVTDYLDPNLDWSTFQLGDSAIGDQTIATTGDPGLSYSRVVIPDYRPGVSKNWWVDVTAQLNNQAGRVDWVFRTLDPETGELPEDAAAGFLPPNDATGRGEGHVSFSIIPKPRVAMGTRITNTASIVFDTNPAIQTNEVWNTLGKVAPEHTTLSSSRNPSLVGQMVTFTASVTSSVGTPTGQVTIYDRGVILGSGNLVDGVMTYSTAALIAGTHPITAAYGGDATFAPSTSNVLSQAVTSACTPVGGAGFIFAPAAPKVGQSVSFTAAITAGTLPITYTWKFGDGQQTVVTTPQVKHTFPLTNTVRTYAVLLSAANACGSQPVQRSVAVWPLRVYLPLVRR
jgi:uncharacterized repeat protein (TIGR01451 family)